MTTLKFAYFAQEKDGAIVRWPIDWQEIADAVGLYNSNDLPDRLISMDNGYVKVYEPLQALAPDPDFEYLEEVPPVKEGMYWHRGYAIKQLSIEAIDYVISRVRSETDARINEGRQASNGRYFLYKGKKIACDRLSKDDIFGANHQIVNNGDKLPTNWVGAWKSVDNSFVPIATVEEWKALYKCMYDQGIVNFAHSNALKEMAKAAKSVEELRAINWETATPYKAYAIPLEG